MASDDHFLYFAFGSNLYQQRIHVQIRGAEYVGNGLLYGYQLAFFDHGERWMGAVASIEPVDCLEDKGHVYGCVYKVPHDFAEELDRQEAGYDRHEVTIRWVDSDSTVVCRTYRYAAVDRKPQLPSPHYKEVIVAGAKQHGLPEHYIERLISLPHNGFNGRVELDLEAIKHLNQ